MMVARASLLPAIVPFAAIFVVFVGMNWMHWPHRMAIAVIAVLSYVLWWQVLQQGWWAIVSFATAVFLATLYVSKIDVFGSTGGRSAQAPSTVIDTRTPSVATPTKQQDGHAVVV